MCDESPKLTQYKKSFGKALKLQMLKQIYNRFKYISFNFINKMKNLHHLDCFKEWEDV